LKYYQQRRRPRNTQQNLTSEEFCSIIQDMLGSINLFFEANLDWITFRSTFLQLKRKYRAHVIQIKGIEILSNQNFLIKITVFPGTEINAITSYFWQQYELLLQEKN
jgi:hypothetical protein